MKKINLSFLLCTLLFSLNLSAQSTEFNHTNKFSLSYGVNTSLLKAADLNSISASFAKKGSERLWYEVNFQSATGLFSKFSANNAMATGATDDMLVDQKNKLMSLDLAVGLESSYTQNLLALKDVFEYISAGIGYYSYSEDYSGEKFTGPGIHAKFQVYKRMSDFFSAGLNFNYHLASVKRKALSDTESGSDRSLTLGFATIGLDFNIYL